MLNKLFLQLKNDERGQGMVEYALIIAFVAILIIGSLTIFKDKIVALFTTIAAAF